MILYDPCLRHPWWSHLPFKPYLHPGMMRFLFALAIVLFAPGTNVWSQADSIMRLPSPQRFFALYDWDITTFKQDSLLCKKQLEEFTKTFKKQGATDLEKFAFYLANDQINFTNRRTLQEQAILQAIEYARHQHWTDLVAELQFTLASHLHLDKQDIPAIETMIEKAQPG